MPGSGGPTIRKSQSPVSGVQNFSDETLGDMTRQDASDVAITGGSISGALRTPVPETILVTGAVSITKEYTALSAASGAYAVTLAAPSKPGLLKVIEMTVAGNAITLALTNVQGGSAATSASFDAANEALVLVAGTNKWTVLKEVGVTLS